jgi:hypothetical protein
MKLYLDAIKNIAAEDAVFLYRSNQSILMRRPGGGTETRPNWARAKVFRRREKRKDVV